MSDTLFSPNPGQQTKFLSLTIREALYGGAAGGGKTMALILDPMHFLAVEHGRWIRGEITRSSCWCIHFRRVMPRLLQTINKAEAFYKAVDPGCRYHANDHTFTFSCGMKIQFGHMEKPNSYLDYLGQEYQGIYFDELTEFTEEQYTQLHARLRSSDPVLARMMVIRAASNPVGEGLLWVRRRFVDPWPTGERIIRERVPMDGEVINKDRIFIPAKLKDNPKLDKEYEAELRTMKKASREALLEGNWYVTPGAYFGDEWETDIHVIRPFKIPASWPRYRSMDYGHSAPASVSWWAVNQNNIAVCYRNLYVKKHTAKMLAHRIRELEEDAGEWDKGRNVSRITGPADPACFTKGSGHSGPSLAEEMANEGVVFYPADNERVAGWNQLRERLIARMPDEMMDTLVKDRTGRYRKGREWPAIMWFEDCEAPIRTIPACVRDQHDPEDIDTKCEDHAADDTRYFAMGRPFKAENDNARQWDEPEPEPEPAERATGTFSYSGW